jgi:hypothetical protein
VKLAIESVNNGDGVLSVINMEGKTVLQNQSIFTVEKLSS